MGKYLDLARGGFGVVTPPEGPAIDHRRELSEKSELRVKTPYAVDCIHGSTADKCAVCSGFVRWLIADEDRFTRGQSNPEVVRREFWREAREARII